MLVKEWVSHDESTHNVPSHIGSHCFAMMPYATISRRTELALLSYSALSTRVWMHRSLQKLSHRLISIYTILHIKICYIKKKYIHMYIIVDVPARICEPVLTRKDMALSAISMNSALADKEFVLSLHHKLHVSTCINKPNDVHKHNQSIFHSINQSFLHKQQ